MSYQDPKSVLSPKGSIKDIEIIYDGGENSWSLAKMKWDNWPVIGMRWNGGSGNGQPSIGNPQSRGYATWFVVPDEVGEAIEKMIHLARLAKTHPLLVRHNTPELLKRRTAKIAGSNSGQTAESDNALADVLEEFQKLSF
jgi:hypothetical protein